MQTAWRRAVEREVNWQGSEGRRGITHQRRTALARSVLQQREGWGSRLADWRSPCREEPLGLLDSEYLARSVERYTVFDGLPKFIDGNKHQFLNIDQGFSTVFVSNLTGDSDRGATKRPDR